MKRKSSLDRIARALERIAQSQEEFVQIVKESSFDMRNSCGIRSEKPVRGFRISDIGN